MPVSTTIRFEAMEPSPALREDIERHVHKLSQLSPRLTSCDVAVRRSEQRHVHGNRYLVRVSASLDGIPFEAGRTPPKDRSHEDAYIATRDAFDALRRQLEDHVRARRDGVRRAAPVAMSLFH